MCREATCALDCDPRSVRAGRRFVVDTLKSWGVGPADAATTRVPDLLLTASELLGNAVRHSSGAEIRLSLRAHRDELTVEVVDEEPAPAVLRHTGVLDEGGRGLALVEAVAADWGQQRRGTGKAVWASFDVPDGSVLAGGCTR